MLHWNRQHQRAFPWREQSDPYAVIIGEILLQRTRAEHVTAVYNTFIRRWPDGAALSEAKVTAIAQVIRPLGLLKRAPQLKRLGEALVEHGRPPSDPHALMRLPGVGPYVAHAMPIFALHRNLPVVDWVIARVLRRYYGLPASRRPNADQELWELARQLAGYGRARHLWLGTLDFAAAICRPRPRCDECPLASTCTFVLAHAQQAAPQLLESTPVDLLRWQNASRLPTSSIRRSSPRLLASRIATASQPTSAGTQISLRP